MYFDDIEELEENGSFYVIAKDKESGNAYVVTSPARVETSASAYDGYILRVSAPPNTYVYRGEFQSKEEMERFADRIIKLITAADFKTNSIYRR